MNFEDLQNYAASYSVQESEHLARLNRETHLEVLKPRMLSGPLQAAVLQMIVRMLRPEKILEIGTYTGYSALAMAEALPETGRIDTIERNQELRPRVRQTLAAHPDGNKVRVHWGKAAQIIEELEAPFDLVFMDADKENYLNYYLQVLPKMRKGGWLIADNVLWSGKVLTPEQHKDKKTKALVEFTRQVHQDSKNGFHVLLPIRDGLLVIQKT